LFADGVVVSVLNPKIAVFFLAFLPQFVDPGRGSIAQQVLLLGLTYVALALVTDGAYAWLAGSARHLLRGRIVQGPLPRYASGAVYLGLGVSTALADRRQ
jgi:threonine/homoserine/homoserine lactone efflux protein